jgi:hypothetical protein
MELKNLEIVREGDEARLRCEVAWAGGRDVLWYGVDARHAAHLSADRYDGVLVGLLLKAMALGEDVEVRGTVSDRLHFSLSHYYMDIVSQVLPRLRPVRVHAERLDSGAGRERPAGVGTGFSAGVDSFAVLHDHHLREDRPGWRVTHLLFNNVGSHGERGGEAARALFRQRFGAVRGWPEDAGLELVRVDSNLSELLQMDFEETHTPRNFSVVLQMQPLFGRYYYASTFRYRDCFVGPTYDMAYSDPFAVHLLSTETLDCVPTGSQHTRVAKTALVARVPGAPRWLNVCANVTAGGRNCSTCAKCCRTLLTLEMLGELDAFAGAFDLGAWRRVRNRYVSSEVLARGRASPFTAEILEYAARTGWRFSAWQQAARVLNLLPRPLVRLGRSVRRRWLGGP